jgi:DNA-binding NarL/FixJ family response regulator
MVQVSSGSARSVQYRDGPSPGLPLRTVILGVYPITRQAMSVMLASLPDVEVVGEGPVGLRAADPLLALDPDVVIVGPVNELLPQPVWPAALPGSTRPAVVALVATDEAEVILSALRAGAHSVLRAAIGCDDLVNALGVIRRGYACLPIELLARGLVVPDKVSQTLAPKELEVLRLMAEGKTNKEIARLLKLSRKTVDTYRVRLQHKLHASSRVEAVATAIRRGLL